VATIDEVVLQSALQDGVNILLNGPDGYILEVAASERSICHRLAIHLSDSLGESLSDLSVDCDYNREGLDPKSVDAGVLDELRERAVVLNPSNDSDFVLVLPDIVIHSEETTTAMS
jgi:hypothetical protein